MAIKVKQAAAGNAPATGMEKTPAAKVIPPAPSLREKDTGGEYGENHYTGASSTPMNAIPQSPMGRNLTASVDDDGVLAELIAKGSARDDSGDLRGSSQLRHDYDDAKGYPPANGAVRQQDPNFWTKKSALPEKQSDNETRPVRKPD